MKTSASAAISPLIVALGLCMTPDSNAWEPRQHQLPAQMDLAGHLLTLNGTATRTVFGVGVYDVGLYLVSSQRDEISIMEQDRHPKSLLMIMLRQVGPEKFASAVRENLSKNFTDAERTAFAPQLAAFLACFETDVDLQKGTRVAIEYLPGKGMVVSVDDRTLAVIPGEDFYHAILRLWIGNPLQPSIKSGLLGGRK